MRSFSIHSLGVSLLAPFFVATLSGCMEVKEDEPKLGDFVRSPLVRTHVQNIDCPPTDVTEAGAGDPHIVSLTLYFNTDKHECGGDHTHAIDRAIKAVSSSQHLQSDGKGEDRRRAKVVVLGYTDQRASVVYNEALGHRRAQDLAEKLGARGFYVDRFSCGESFAEGAGNVPKDRRATALFYSEDSDAQSSQNNSPQSPKQALKDLCLIAKDPTDPTDPDLNIMRIESALRLR